MHAEVTGLLRVLISERKSALPALYRVEGRKTVSEKKAEIPLLKSWLLKNAVTAESCSVSSLLCRLLMPLFMALIIFLCNLSFCSNRF